MSKKKLTKWKFKVKEHLNLRCLEKVGHGCHVFIILIVNDRCITDDELDEMGTHNHFTLIQRLL